MAHKTLVNGTSCDVQGGKCLVGGTAYNILKGRTLIGGTGYDINFSSMPKKGDTIKLKLSAATEDYRVLNIDGTIAEVLCMVDYGSMALNENQTNTYKWSLVDDYLNISWYGSLYSNAKDAIVPKSIIQHGFDYNSAVYNSRTHASYADRSTKSIYGTVGEKYVYALDVEDVEAYFDYGNYGFNEIKTLFWGAASYADMKDTNIWLRSAENNDRQYGWCSYGGAYGALFKAKYSEIAVVRPAFQIDLSKIDFTIN